MKEDTHVIPQDDSGADRRGTTRMAARFWVQVMGLEEAPKQRRGNISISGIFFEFNQSMGGTGSLATLRAAPLEKGPFVEMLARVVRVVSCEDIWSGSSVAGVALEYLMQGEELRSQIEDLVKGIAALQIERSRELQVLSGVPGEIVCEDSSGPRIEVRQISLQGLTVEADRPTTVGETITLTISMPVSNRACSIHGRVIRCVPINRQGKDAFVTEVAFEDAPSSQGSSRRQELEAAVGFSIPDAIDELLIETLSPNATIARVPAATALKGSLERVSLSSLLGFLELEQQTGVLHLSLAGKKAALYLRAGGLLDVDLDGPAQGPAKALALLLDESTGEFEFVVGEVNRPDRIGEKIGTLLLENARHRDDGARRKKSDHSA